MNGKREKLKRYGLIRILTCVLSTRSVIGGTIMNRANCGYVGCPWELESTYILQKLKLGGKKAWSKKYTRGVKHFV